MGVVSALKKQKSMSDGFPDYLSNSLRVCGDQVSCCSTTPSIIITTILIIAGPIYEIIIGNI